MSDSADTTLRIRDEIYPWLLAAMAFVIPLYDKLVVYFIALLILYWLVSGDWKGRIQRLSWRINGKCLIVLTGFYLFHWVGLLYTQNFHYAWFDLGIKTGLVAFPLILGSVDIDRFRPGNFLIILMAFVAGCLLISLFLFGAAIAHFLQGGTFSVFLYTSLSGFHHASYLSMYLVMAVTILLIMIGEGFSTEIPVPGSILWGILLWFLIFILLLSSKAGILIMALIWVLYLAHVWFRNKNRRLGGTMLIVLVILFLMVWRVLPATVSRFSAAGQAVENRNHLSAQTTDGTAERMLIWKSSLKIISGNPWLGVGTGDVKDELLNYYKDKGISNALTLKLNAHNQYLQTAIALGLVGLILLLAALLVPAWIAMREKNLLLLFFLLISGTNFLFESMLERQAGVVFFGFFSSFLFFIGRRYYVEILFKKHLST